MPIISKNKQWSKTESGIILSSFFWGYMLTQVISGYISDRIGGHKVLMFAAFGWASTTYFMPNLIELLSNDVTSVLLLAVMRAINGAFQGNVNNWGVENTMMRIFPF